MFPFCRTKHKYWEMKAAHSSLNEFIDPLESLWNQGKAGPCRLAGNTLHKRRSFPVLRIIVWLKCSIWLCGSAESSYIANDGITKPRGEGGARNLGYAGLGMRITYHLAPGQLEKKSNAGRRLPRMGDAWAETEEPCPRAGQAHTRGPVPNAVCLC